MKRLILAAVVIVLVSAVLVFVLTRKKDAGGSVLWVVSDTNGTLSSHPLDTNNFREVQTVVITNRPK